MELRLVARTGGLCPACHTRQRAETCVRCGRLRPAVRRRPDGPVCLRCYRYEPDTQVECTRCGRRSWSDARTPEGPLCSSCRPRLKEPCHLCGQMRAFRTILMGGPVCRLCFLQLRRTPYPCPLCAKTKVLAFHAQRAPGQRVCAACAGEPSPFACRQCGSEEHHYGSRCAVCVLAERATTLLSGPDGHVVPQLQPALRALLAVERPKSTLFWLQTSDAAVILRDRALGRIPVTHQVLDALPRTHRLDHLRDFLIVAGVLPERPVPFDRLAPWLERLLADRPVDQARIVRAYAVRHVLRRIRARAAHTPITVSQAQRARGCLRRAADLLAWLDARGQDLAGLRQADLEQWLIETPNSRNHTQLFLSWARARSLTGAVRVYRPPEGEPAQMMDHDRRWALVNDLLHQQQIAVELRVAGLFVLLFGRPLTRIVQLTVDDVCLDGPGVRVGFAHDAIVLPDPLTDLVRELIGRREQSSFSAEPRKWLFPGGAPGRHLTTSTLGSRLRVLGLPTRAARNTALMQLAAHMPSPILAGMIGLTPKRAAACGDLAKRDWAAYTVHRDDRRRTVRSHSPRGLPPE